MVLSLSGRFWPFYFQIRDFSLICFIIVEPSSVLRNYTYLFLIYWLKISNFTSIDHKFIQFCIWAGAVLGFVDFNHSIKCCCILYAARVSGFNLYDPITLIVLFEIMFENIWSFSQSFYTFSENPLGLPYTFTIVKKKNYNFMCIINVYFQLYVFKNDSFFP